jgi:hypothetical protein
MIEGTSFAEAKISLALNSPSRVNVRGALLEWQDHNHINHPSDFQAVEKKQPTIHQFPGGQFRPTPKTHLKTAMSFSSFDAPSHQP